MKRNHSSELIDILEELEWEAKTEMIQTEDMIPSVARETEPRESMELCVEECPNPRSDIGDCQSVETDHPVRESQSVEKVPSVENRAQLSEYKCYSVENEEELENKTQSEVELIRPETLSVVDSPCIVETAGLSVETEGPSVERDISKVGGRLMP